MNRKALILMHSKPAAEIYETENGFEIKYVEGYKGEPISHTLPVKYGKYKFNEFPAFLEGLLPEGIMLEIFLKKYKIDVKNYFDQLLVVGKDLIGAVTVEELKK